jgi:hypothetical protein
MKDKEFKLSVPRWVTIVYVVMSAILIPWTIYLGASLPAHHLSAHWDISWSGLDIAIILAMLATGIFAYLRSAWIVISSSIVGTLLVVDAWFDVMSERRALQLHEAIFLAILFELPLAFTSYYVAHKVLLSRD